MVEGVRTILMYGLVPPWIAAGIGEWDPVTVARISNATLAS